MPRPGTRSFPLRATFRRALAPIIGLALVAAPLLAQDAPGPRVSPLFEVFGTWSRPPFADGPREAYELGGTVQGGGGLGLAVGVLLWSRVEVAGFYEGGTAALSGTTITGSRVSLGRNAAGLRVEVPVLDLGRGFHVLLSGSVAQQQLERVTFSAPSPGSGTAQVTLSQRALGGRVEAGLEHRAFFGTTWFATGGVTMAGSGTGAWQSVTPTRGGTGMAPIVTVGVRTRSWSSPP